MDPAIGLYGAELLGHTTEDVEVTICNGSGYVCWGAKGAKGIPIIPPVV